MISAVDKEGTELPWYTYSAISFLTDRVGPSFKVFEYGSGNSTLWWARRVEVLVACEHDHLWYTQIAKLVPKWVDYRYCELVDGGDYCQVISEYKEFFDIVVIDGRDRVNCVKNSIGALAEHGVIVWDNSERNAYKEGRSYLLEHGFRRLDFWGIGPNGVTGWCTSVFYRHNNCLGI